MTSYPSAADAIQVRERTKEYLLIKMQIALLQTYTEQEGLYYTGIYLKKALLCLSEECLEKS